MIEWWNSLEPAMKVLWAVTLSASLVFVIQTVMTFLGAAGDTDFDINSDFDTDAPSDISDGSADAGGHGTEHPSTGMNITLLARRYAEASHHHCQHHRHHCSFYADHTFLVS